jgi:hypothetical protein
MMTNEQTQTKQRTTRPRIRRSDDRGVQNLGWSTNYLTFSFADYNDPDWMHFGPLRVLIESHIEPGEGFSEHPHRHAEIISYVTEGVLRHRDSSGHKADITTGEMQLISAGSRGIVHSETNPLETPEAHYQLWLVPDRPDTDVAYHELTPSSDEREDQFRLYVSPDGRDDTMPVNTDAYVYAGQFSAGDDATHALASGRGAWVQVVEGTISVGDVTLREGDGAGFTNPETLQISFQTPAEVLLVDVRMDAPRVWE